MQQQPMKLWVQLLTQKYVKNGCFMDGVKKQGSVVWNSISKAKSILKDGYSMRIGAGEVSFWFDSWTKWGPLCQYVDFVKVHINMQVKDSLIWKENMHGNYTTKSVFSWLLKQREDGTDPKSWGWIWKINAPEKVKFFIWLACHKATPTYSLLHSRGMAGSSICQRCNQEEETFLHMVRDCPGSMRVWNFLGLWDSDFSQQQDHVEWLRNGASKENDFLFLAGLWWTWRLRNIQCVAKEDIHFHKLISEIHNLASVIKLTFHSPQNSQRMERWVRWHPSRENVFILNVDGSSLGNPGRAGFRGLIRNSDGAWLAGFAGHIGYSDNTHAEFLGIFHGLQLAWRLGYKELICYSDSKTAIMLINEAISDFHCYAPLVFDIRDQIHLDWSVRLQHTLREGNQCADFLAKLGANQGENLKIFEAPPNGISHLLMADYTGVAFLRE